MLASRAYSQRFVRVTPFAVVEESSVSAFSSTHRRRANRQVHQRQLSTTATGQGGQQRARVIVLGSGRMGKIRTALLQANPRFAVQGIVDSNLTSAVALAETYGLPAYESLEAALDRSSMPSTTSIPSPPIDGIIISTPTFTHRKLIRQAADANISVFVEKPVDETADQITDLFDYATNVRGIHLCCGFQRRFDPSYVAAQQAVTQQGQIGQPIAANIFFADHPRPSREFLLSGGNIFYDLSAHDVDYITATLQDEIVSVYATGTSSDAELQAANVHDNATMVMKTKKGAVVTLFLSRSASYGYDQRCEIFGTAGMVQVQNVPEHTAVVGTASGMHHARFQHSFPQRFQQAFGLELNAFADTLLNAIPWPVTAQQCIHVQRCADAARLSCETGNVVYLDKKEMDKPSRR